VSGQSQADERLRVLKLTLSLLAFALLQAAVLILLGPWIFARLSHGRWDAGEIKRLLGWLPWILLGAALFGSSLLLFSWQMLRQTARGFFVRVSMPWFLFAVGAYGSAAHWGGVEQVAQANVAVGGLYLFLSCLLLVKSRP
jgi:hypothetical protein